MEERYNPFSRVADYIINSLDKSYDVLFSNGIASLAEVVAGIMIFVVMFYGYRLLTMSSQAPLRDSYIVVFKIIVVYIIIIASAAEVKTKNISTPGGNGSYTTKDHSTTFYTKYVKKSWGG